MSITHPFAHEILGLSANFSLSAKQIQLLNKPGEATNHQVAHQHLKQRKKSLESWEILIKNISQQLSFTTIQHAKCVWIRGMRPQKLAVNGERQKKTSLKHLLQTFLFQVPAQHEERKIRCSESFYLKSQRFRKFIHKFGFHDAKSQPLIIHSKFENNILLCCAVYQISSSRKTKSFLHFSSSLCMSFYLLHFICTN